MLESELILTYTDYSTLVNRNLEANSAEFMKPLFERTMMKISNLSLDVLLHILSFLPPRDVILGARQVRIHAHTYVKWLLD